MVSFPAAILPELQHDLDTYSLDGRMDGVCQRTRAAVASRKLQCGSRLAGASRADWSPNLHLHDLRHSGNTLAVQSGASLRDLMPRMGHDSQLLP